MYLSDCLLMLMGSSTLLLPVSWKLSLDTGLDSGFSFFAQVLLFFFRKYVSGGPIRDAGFDHLIVVVTGISPLSTVFLLQVICTAFEH